MDLPEDRTVAQRHHHRDSQTAEQACNECRRRKSKCNRLVPICGLCTKFRRICEYEKIAKTPLTRRHLTEVENELASLKRYVQERLETQQPSRFDNAADAQKLGEGSWQTPTSPTNRHAPESSFASNHALNRVSTFGPTNTPNESTSNHPVEHINPTNSAQFSLGSGVDRTVPANLPDSDHISQRPTAEMMLETPPASGEFDWDERTSLTPGSKFADGMASLSSAQRGGGGYLGVASGAALLRLADTRSQQGDSGNSDIPSAARIPAIPFKTWSLGELEPHIDSYFQLYHVSYPIVHEATFRAQFMEVIPRPKTSIWQGLLYTIAALGAFTAAIRAKGSRLHPLQPERGKPPGRCLSCHLVSS